MMISDYFLFPVPEPQLTDNTFTDQWMFFNFFILGIRQPAGFEQNIIPNADFSNIMKTAGKIKDINLFFGTSTGPCNNNRRILDAG